MSKTTAAPYSNKNPGLGDPGEVGQAITAVEMRVEVVANQIKRWRKKEYAN
jgi:hypothetical protein